MTLHKGLASMNEQQESRTEVTSSRQPWESPVLQSLRFDATASGGIPTILESEDLTKES